MTVISGFLLAVLCVVMFVKVRRDTRRRVIAHAGVFDDCRELLSQPRDGADAAHLPVLQGSYRGYRVALSIVEDTLGWRKVPPLWLLVRVEAERPSRGTLDFIVRPSGNEFYSPAWEWDGTLDLPPGWPQHAICKYRREAADVAALEAHVPGLFADVAMKELLVTPSMVRLTYLAKQAERGEYLIMRNAIYDGEALDKNLVARLLDQAVAIRADLERPQWQPQQQELVHACPT
jgi:hypothetical protein